MRRLLCLALVLATAPAAHAAGWTPPTTYPAASGKSYAGEDLAPRGAVAADGTGVLAWSEGDDKSRRGIFVATRTGARFGPRLRLSTRRSDVAVAAAPRGGAAVAWTERDGTHVALRRAGARRFTERVVIRLASGDISGAEIAADPTGGYVVAERRFPLTGSGLPYTLRAVRLDASGRPGPVTDLGQGFVSLDARPAFPLAVDASGRARLAFDGERDSDAALVTAQPGAPFAPRGSGLGADAADPRVAVDDAGRVAVAFTATERRGDAGSFGAPAIALGGPDGTLHGARRVALTHPARAFGPSVAALGAGRFVLAWQQKTGEDAFSTQAPVRAAVVGADGRIGTARTLTSVAAKEPVVVALAGGRALAVFGTPTRFGAALASSDGRFRPIAAPRGTVAPNHFNETNRDVRSAGRYAIVAWADGGDVRVSVRRF